MPDEHPVQVAIGQSVQKFPRRHAFLAIDLFCQGGARKKHDTDCRLRCWRLLRRDCGSRGARRLSGAADLPGAV
jgi:hypothetical protein